jgi:hypothetical protein
MKFLKDGSISMDKELNKLDKFVLDFISVLKKHTEYAIISGYVSILFGRSRATEDIDLIVLRMEKKAFLALFKDLSRRFECLNSSKPEELYCDYLCQNTAIRFSYKGKPIPNMELKFAKTEIDYGTIKQRLCVKMGKKELFISPIELQIAFKKIVLGSDKDIEDAEHLKTVFEKHLNMHKLKEYERLLKR